MTSPCFREASRHLSMRRHSFMDFSVPQLSVLHSQNKALKEFVHCVPSTHTPALLSGTANAWKMLY